MVHQPDELAVTIARQERTVRVHVVVCELELEVTAMGQDQDRGVPDQLVRRNPDPGMHAAVGPLLGAPEVSVGEQSAYRRPVLPAQLRQFFLHSDRHRLEPSKPPRMADTDVFLPGASVRAEVTQPTSTVTGGPPAMRPFRIQTCRRPPGSCLPA